MKWKSEKTELMCRFGSQGGAGGVGVLGVCGGRAGGRGIELPTGEVPWLKTTVSMVRFFPAPL